MPQPIAARRPRVGRACLLPLPLPLPLPLLLAAVATVACARSPRSDEAARSAPSAPPAAARGGVDSLTDRRWTLLELDGRPATPGPGGEAPYLRLRSDTARVEGSTGCNSLFGRYERRAPDVLRFDALGSTRRACVDSVPANQESRFVAALTATRRYAIRGDTLTLLDDATLRARLMAPAR